jgi:hypothetical protein
MCVCVLYLYSMIVGLQLLPTETMVSTKREVYYKGEKELHLYTKRNESREREKTI